MTFLKQVSHRNRGFEFHSLFKVILWLLLLGILTIILFLEQGVSIAQTVFAAVSSIESPESKVGDFNSKNFLHSIKMVENNHNKIFIHTIE